MTGVPNFRIQPLIELHDARGRLVVAETGRQIPFEVKRIFIISHVESGSNRGGHAHRQLEQFLIMMSGSCVVTVDTGAQRSTFVLDRTSVGLHAPPMCWLELTDFSPDGVCAVLASDHYVESDYIRDRAEFERLAGEAAALGSETDQRDI